jgi:succinate dehydrogenase/fumarate reductase flavoprotein subunit
MIYEYAVLIIGSGIAGLVTSLTAAEKCRVASLLQDNRSYASYIEDQEENTSTTSH